MGCGGANWTDEEVAYLEENISKISIKCIAKNLKRPIGGVENKANRIGLSRRSITSDKVSFGELTKAFNSSGSFITNKWVSKFNMPYDKIKSKNGNVTKRYINLEEFWKWAEKYKNYIDFSKLEENMLGAEPNWVKEKRKIDFKNLTYKKVNVPWSDYEIITLKTMLKQFKHSYKEISDAISRTEGAIESKILELGLKERPIRAAAHSHWNEQQTNILIEMYYKGYGNNSIADKVDKSARAVEGKIDRLKKMGEIK